MSNNAKPQRPIYVIKKKGGHGGHHGGAWKVAYADFVTAMMSLFIVLWLLNSTPEIKKAVSGYFNDPHSSGSQTGTLSLGSGESVSIDRKNVEKLKEEIQKAILKQTDLTKLSKQIDISMTGEGLKIDLIEDQGGTFFESGSPKLSETGVALLNVLSTQLKALPNRLLIEGHTDARPYSTDNGYTNWELSSDRANSTRRLLQQGGVPSSQISQVRGFADQSLRVPSNPMDPSNRRVSLIVQWVDLSMPPPAPAPGTADSKDAKDSGEAGKPSTPTPDAAPNPGKPSTPTPGAAPNPGKPAAASDKPSPTGTAAPAKTPAAPPAPAPVAPTAPKPTWMTRIKGMLPGHK
jgi:chemotaxis protein MotB